MEYKIKEYLGKPQIERYKLQTVGKNPLIVIGVNPSYATDTIKDLTISKLLKFANQYRKDGLIMLNLIAEVKKNPNEISKENDLTKHKINLEIIKKVLNEFGENCEVLACWGNSIEKRKYLLDNLIDINSIQEIKWKCLGDLTVNGHPRHPSRAKYDLKYANFDIKKYLRDKK